MVKSFAPFEHAATCMTDRHAYRSKQLDAVLYLANDTAVPQDLHVDWLLDVDFAFKHKLLQLRQVQRLVHDRVPAGGYLVRTTRLETQ